MTKEVEITSLTYGGRGLGRIDGKIAEVTAPSADRV